MCDPANWQPTISMQNLVKRAKFMQQIRDFFTSRNVLEVDTPMLSQATITDVHLHPFQTTWRAEPHAKEKTYYLMTSPEYHMKRLLAAGSGSIFQLNRCFRNEEIGRYHNPEFTLCEWYRLDFEMDDLINEVDELLQTLLHCPTSEKIAYSAAFEAHLNLDPLTATFAELQTKATEMGFGEIAQHETDRNMLLQLLFSFGVEPKIGQHAPVAVYHFPASQASLAKLDEHDPRVAKRFEFYYKGIELANGFQELSDAEEQRGRFENDNDLRQKMHLPKQPIDEHFLAALNAGLPNCSGVALGVDRVMMLAFDAKTIQDVIAFPADRA